MIRNFIFSIFFFTGIMIISLIFLPAFFFPRKVVLFGGKLMGYWTSFCLKFFLNTKIIIKESDRPLIIFPQGTRVLPNERPSFKKGASRIYEELKISCQPVAINSGYVWPKKGYKNSNKVITISILKPIMAGHSKEEFIKILENNIYEELNLLN